ncbi:PAQR family membrane homeostasis protein TrhA [Phycisphaera mikurensis]|uniref:Putative hemolysin n=1 Tax=Phycisphaera mikurensis (strain NBRC 102666 / KCTC 22515 / FYK2301M01) TaxID=1142394 RepID=I0IGN8_PHYMF|nr:hemolysin III family protein [Phycisphaera mikurensis]MBB6443216.1 hemolysin III [Phycisphaera mikurensis]BAM04426.1 putative hemolysin [Phycisphaera mikurensis NBRC 102666]
MRLSRWFPNPQLPSSPTPAEERANLASHAAAAVLAALAGVWLAVGSPSAAPPVLVWTGVFFALAMAVTFAASAAYHLHAEGPRKDRARRADHAMIYAAIAATYTPFAVAVIGGAVGLGLAATQWTLAAVGVWICLRHFHRFGWVQLGLKLAMGWMMLPVAGPAVAAIPPASLAWLLAGGVVYTVGVVFFLMEGLPFNHAIWHGFVVGGAGCHLVAVERAIAAAAAG